MIKTHGMAQRENVSIPTKKKTATNHQQLIADKKNFNPTNVFHIVSTFNYYMERKETSKGGNFHHTFEPPSKGTGLASLA